MTRISLIYGSIAGLVIIATMIVGYALSGGEGAGASQWFGFLIMFVALTLIFIGIKRYRDQEHGGVIKFGKAFMMGLGISLVASVIYVVTWEVYLVLTDYAFADTYVAAVTANFEARGLTEADLQEKLAALEASMSNYHNPLYRVPLTFTEIFPVAVLVTLVSAALLRNPKLLPARG